MNKSNMSVEALKRLLLLQQSRIVAEEKKLHMVKKEYEEAKVKYLQREKDILDINQRVQANHKYLKTGVDEQSLSALHRGYQIRYWLNYDLEMHEYYLVQERATLDETKEKYDMSMRRWIKLRKKIEMFTKLYKQRERQLADLTEERSIEEVQEDSCMKRSVVNGKNY